MYKLNRPKKLRLLSTNLGSQSLKRVAEGLSSRLGYKVWRSMIPKPNKIHLRYGDQKDKIYQYRWFEQEGIPALTYTTEKGVADSWSVDGTVVCRLLTRASEGKGIVIAETPEQVVAAPVYTQYKKKKKEFRIHIFKDKVIHVVEKRKRKDWTEQRESKVRNLANGYVFCSDNVVEPTGLRELALRAAKVTESDFKGVDIGWNEKKDELFVIEVNSAPGIEGTNVNRYIEEIVKCV